MADQPDIQPPPAPPVVVKKYANRRLYNTETSCYITLDNLAEMVRKGRDFVVYDAKSGEDITRGVLTQIIVEEEGKGRSLLPTTFLRQLIGFYGDQMQAFVPRYLEQSMAALAQQQGQMQNAMQKTMGTLFPLGGAAVNEIGRQNVAMMERAMSLFNPFYRGPEEPAKAADAEQALAQAQDEAKALRAEAEAQRMQLAEAAGREQEIAALRAEIEALRGDLARARAAQSVAAAAEAPKESPGTARKSPAKAAR